MEFSPFNNVVKLCLQGMSMEEAKQPEEALKIFMQAWSGATNDHECFLAAYYVARQQKTVSDRLIWLEKALSHALKLNDNTVKSALPNLYQKLAKCYGDLGDSQKSAEYAELSTILNEKPSDTGPFYHGTKADLKVGDLLTAGGKSNYQPELTMNHIYFTGLVSGAGLAAALAKGEGRERVYIIEPTGTFENDPNLTDKKFPGNPTRSYRSTAALKIVGEVEDWDRPSLEDLQRFRERRTEGNGEIIN
ncbi:NAD(+)--rifampin ADP-ribosyltransferase [Sphingobacterium athyrii]|uniref:NAD(+)--rifampin ADP-ribosyltransferase n=1 Tax=Sphingobacterium athyrii TaxID=2152717 RepID=A0A363NW59_9SPHI|nr:NAD(+)--rifampin ADP-ribosyltransferase [Sphingobacterium athyrii]